MSQSTAGKLIGIVALSIALPWAVMRYLAPRTALELARVLSSDGGAVLSIAMSDSGRDLYCGIVSPAGAVVRWDVLAGVKAVEVAIAEAPVALATDSLSNLYVACGRRQSNLPNHDPFIAGDYKAVGAVRVLDASTLVERGVIETNFELCDLEVSKNGEYLALLGAAGGRVYIEIRQCTDQEIIYSNELYGSLPPCGVFGPVRLLAFSSDARHLLVASSAKLVDESEPGNTDITKPSTLAETMGMHTGTIKVINIKYGTLIEAARTPGLVRFFDVSESAKTAIICAGDTCGQIDLNFDQIDDAKPNGDWEFVFGMATAARFVAAGRIVGMEMTAGRLHAPQGVLLDATNAEKSPERGHRIMGRLKTTAEEKRRPLALEVDQSGNVVAVGDDHGSVWMWRLAE